MASGSQKIALQLAQEILRNTELQEIPLSAVLLRCRRLARLVDDQEAYAWFGYELTGYPVDDNGLVEARAFQVGLAHGRGAGKNAQSPLMNARTVATLEATAGASELRLRQEREPDIHHVPANQFDTLPHSTGHLIRGQLVNDITAARHQLTKIQAHVHRWVEGIAYELEFAEVTVNVWEKRRQFVDARLAQIAPEAFRRFRTLYDRMTEDDPEAWSQAAQTVRNIMKAMADSLRPADGQGSAEGPDGQPIEATDEKYKNRLMIFIRERQKDSKMAQLLEGKVESLYRAVRDVYNAASDAAKREISRTHIEDIVLHLYLLLGDLVILAGDERRIPKEKVSEATAVTGVPEEAQNG